MELCEPFISQVRIFEPLQVSTAPPHNFPISAACFRQFEIEKTIEMSLT